MKSFARLLFWVHKQAGLWLAIFFVILGLTGSISIFMRDIEPVLHAKYLFPELPMGEYRASTLDSVLKSYRQQGIEGQRVLRLYPPTNKDNVFRIVASSIDLETKRFTGDYFYHYISPYNAEYLGTHLVKTSKSNRWSMPATRLILQIHTQLMAGWKGELFVGLVGIVFFVTIISGFYLWWPKNWKKAFSVSFKSNIIRVMLDLHKQIGFWAGLVLLMITFTGLYLSFPDESEKVTGLFLPYGETSKALSLIEVRNPNQLQSYADYVWGLYPNAKNMQLLLNDLDKQRLTVRVSQDGEINHSEGKTTLTFKYPKGQLIKHYTPETTHAGSRFIHWILPLHNCEAFGLIGRVICAFIGLMPLLLFISGFFVFYKKYRARYGGGMGSFLVAVFSFK